MLGRHRTLLKQWRRAVLRASKPLLVENNLRQSLFNFVRLGSLERLSCGNLNLLSSILASCYCSIDVIVAGAFYRCGNTAMAEKQDLPQLVTEAGDKTDLEAGGASNGDSEDDSPFTSSRSACGHGTKRPRIRAKRLLLNLLLGLVAVAVVASHVRLIRATLRKHQAYRSVVPHKERPGMCSTHAFKCYVQLRE